MIGDRSMSVLAGPVAAIRAGRSICDDARRLDIEVRAGVHTALSRTVCDLIGGSGLEVRSRGTHRLKGICEPWELFSAAGENLAVTSIPEQRTAPPRAQTALRNSWGCRDPGTRVEITHSCLT